MKILITGGAGFIGSHLAERLATHEVTVFDDLSTGKLTNLPDGVTFIEGDIRDYDSLVKAFTGIEYVFHLAAIPSVLYSVEHPERTHNVNINGTLNVLRAAAKCKVKKVIFASSSSVYGDSLTPSHEHLVLSPTNPYAVHKATGEMYCRIYNSLYGVPTLSLRFFNVYGPRQRTGVIPHFVQATKEKKPLPIRGDGTQKRDFVHVSDVVNALIKAMETDLDGMEINIGSGHALSVLELAELFGTYREFMPTRGEVQDTLADITLANALLNWYPIMSIEKGIENMVK